MSEAVSTLEVEVAPAQPGRQLAAARESCGLSVADVAHQLKLSPAQVEAMEAGNYQRLPGAVFVRGFIRNYARLVKLDPALLLADAERQLRPAVQPEPELQHSVNIPFPTGRDFRWRKYAIVALLVAVVIFGFYRDDAIDAIVSSRQVALPQAQVVAQQHAVEEIVVPPAAVLSDATAESARTEPAATQTEKIEAQKKSTISTRTAAVTHEPDEHLIKFRFDRESWVEIRDRNGRKIFSQLNPAGTEQAVSGRPPLTLVVGNAPGVRLTRNGQPVDLAPYTNVDVARLTLE
jgi:cytoskeleton protein RodZ